MAPAIAHFLAGAGLALLIATPLVLRYEIDRSWGLWLVPLGGLWGLIPDVHNIIPVYQPQFRALHDSAWVDLFAFHYLLDRPTIRELYLESVFLAILFFLGTVFVFSYAQTLYEAESVVTTRIEQRLAVVVITMASTAYAGVVVSVIVLNMGRYDLLAALIGRDGHFAGWFVLAAGSIAVGSGLAILLEGLLPVPYRTDPKYGLQAGLLVAIVGWGIASVVLPLWVRTVSDIPASIPYIDLVSLVAVGSFVGVFVLFYTLFRGADIVTLRNENAPS